MTIPSEMKSESLIPVVLILVVLMVVGLVGNLHVVLVYAFRLKTTNHGIYIILLSVQDIGASIILIPLTINVYINPWTYSSDTMCKLMNFLGCSIHTGAAFTLLLVAVDRYRKICRPHGWQIKKHIAKRLCFIPVISAIFSSLPILKLREEKTAVMQNTSITMCGTVDGYMKQQLYYIILMAVINLGCLIILVFLYTCVIKAVSKYQSKESVECGKGQLNAESYQVLNRSTEGIMPSPRAAYTNYLGCQNRLPVDEGSTKTKKESSTGGFSTDQIISETSKVNQERRKRARKITLVFIIITVCFCITYIPFISLKIFLAHKQLTLTSQSIHSSIAISFVIPCLYINSVANCFIYSCFDKKFRNEIVTIYKKLCCRS